MPPTAAKASGAGAKEKKPAAARGTRTGKVSSSAAVATNPAAAVATVKISVKDRSQALQLLRSLLRQRDQVPLVASDNVSESQRQQNQPVFKQKKAAKAQPSSSKAAPISLEVPAGGCGVCFGQLATGLKVSMVCCQGCGIRAHSLCAGLWSEAANAKDAAATAWNCDACVSGKGLLGSKFRPRCEICHTSCKGALMSCSSNGLWAHLGCALFTGRWAVQQPYAASDPRLQAGLRRRSWLVVPDLPVLDDSSVCGMCQEESNEDMDDKAAKDDKAGGKACAHTASNSVCCGVCGSSQGRILGCDVAGCECRAHPICALAASALRNKDNSSSSGSRGSAKSPSSASSSPRASSASSWHALLCWRFAEFTRYRPDVCAGRRQCAFDGGLEHAAVMTAAAASTKQSQKSLAVDSDSDNEDSEDNDENSDDDNDNDGDSHDDGDQRNARAVDSVRDLQSEAAHGPLMGKFRLSSSQSTLSRSSSAPSSSSSSSSSSKSASSNAPGVSASQPVSSTRSSSFPNRVAEQPIPSLPTPDYELAHTPWEDDDSLDCFEDLLVDEDDNLDDLDDDEEDDDDDDAARRKQSKAKAESKPAAKSSQSKPQKQSTSTKNVSANASRDNGDHDGCDNTAEEFACDHLHTAVQPLVLCPAHATASGLSQAGFRSLAGLLRIGDTSSSSSASSSSSKSSPEASQASVVVSGITLGDTQFRRQMKLRRDRLKALWARLAQLEALRSSRLAQCQLQLAPVNVAAKAGKSTKSKKAQAGQDNDDADASGDLGDVAVAGSGASSKSKVNHKANKASSSNNKAEENILIPVIDDPQLRTLLRGLYLGIPDHEHELKLSLLLSPAASSEDSGLDKEKKKKAKNGKKGAKNHGGKADNSSLANSFGVASNGKLPLPEPHRQPFLDPADPARRTLVTQRALVKAAENLCLGNAQLENGFYRTLARELPFGADKDAESGARLARACVRLRTWLGAWTWDRLEDQVLALGGLGDGTADKKLLPPGLDTVWVGACAGPQGCGERSWLLGACSRGCGVRGEIRLFRQLEWNEFQGPPQEAVAASASPSSSGNKALLAQDSSVGGKGGASPSKAKKAAAARGKKAAAAKPPGTPPVVRRSSRAAANASARGVRDTLAQELGLPVPQYDPETDPELVPVLEKFGWAAIQPPVNMDGAGAGEALASLRKDKVGQALLAKYPGLGEDQLRLNELHEYRQAAALRSLRYAWELCGEQGKTGKKRAETAKHFSWFAGDMMFLFRHLVFRTEGRVQEYAKALVTQWMRRWDTLEISILRPDAEIEHIMQFTEALHAKRELAWHAPSQLRALTGRLREILGVHAVDDLIKCDPVRASQSAGGGVPITQAGYCAGCGKFENFGHQLCQSCQQPLRREFDYEALLEALVWSSVFREVGVDPIRCADGSCSFEDVLGLLKHIRPYPGVQELGWDSFRLLSYLLTHLIFVLCGWGARSLSVDRGLLLEELTFFLAAQDVCIRRKDPELVGEISQALWMLGVPDWHPVQLRAWNWLLQHEQRNRADGLRQGQWLRGAHWNFYNRYHAAYCVVIGIAPQRTDPAQPEGMPAELRDFFRQTKLRSVPGLDAQLARIAKRRRETQQDEDSDTDHDEHEDQNANRDEVKESIRGSGNSRRQQHQDDDDAEIVVLQDNPSRKQRNQQQQHLQELHHSQLHVVAEDGLELPENPRQHHDDNPEVVQGPEVSLLSTKRGGVNRGARANAGANANPKETVNVPVARGRRRGAAAAKSASADAASSSDEPIEIVVVDA